jgi:hypothetical protein
MQSIFEAAAILFLLFLVLRISLGRRGQEIRLRGGLVTLNVLTGALAGWAAAMAARAAALPAGGPAPVPASAAGTAGFVDLGAAVMRVLPFAGFVLGGLLGHVLFGALWRRFLRQGPAAARAWLRRGQFVIVGIALVALVRHLLG